MDFISQNAECSFDMKKWFPHIHCNQNHKLCFLTWTWRSANLRLTLLNFIVFFSFISPSDLLHLSKKYCEFHFTAIIWKLFIEYMEMYSWDCWFEYHFELLQTKQSLDSWTKSVSIHNGKNSFLMKILSFSQKINENVIKILQHTCWGRLDRGFFLPPNYMETHSVGKNGALWVR